eukprot:6949650-Alexandrium_andersonii.AAC.1
MAADWLFRPSGGEGQIGRASGRADLPPPPGRALSVRDLDQQADAGCLPASCVSWPEHAGVSGRRLRGLTLHE